MPAASGSNKGISEIKEKYRELSFQAHFIYEGFTFLHIT